MAASDTQELRDKITDLSHQLDLQKQQQKFWRWIIIGAAGLSNGDVALTVIKGIVL